MGQRHQAFLIARVVSNGLKPTYRCIAAIHHQWCYGTLPLRAAHRFKRLAQDRDNAALIREEIRTYAKKNEVDSENPCPYSAFMLQVAWAIDQQTGGISGVAPLEASMGSTEGDNNDGITVIDVTDPQNIALCFVQFWEEPPMTPLTPSQYLRGYYPEPSNYNLLSDVEKEQEDAYLEVISNLADVPIIPLATLAEVWPKEYEEDPSAAGVSESASVPPAEASPVGVPSLVNISLAQVLEHAVECDQIELLEHAMSFPDALPAILARLRLVDSFSPKAVEFVAKVFQTSRLTNFPYEADLSGFNFTGEQVLRVLGQPEVVERLDVSENIKFHKEDLLRVVPVLSNLKVLNILQTAITNCDMHSLLNAQPGLLRRIRHTLHPAFIEPKESFPNALIFRLYLSETYSMYFGKQATYSIPLLSVDLVVDAIHDYLKITDNKKSPSMYGINSLSHSALPATLAGLCPHRQPEPARPVWEPVTVSFVPQDALPSSWKQAGYIFLLKTRPKTGSRDWESGNTMGNWEYGIYISRKTHGDGQGLPGKASLANTQEDVYEDEVIDIPTFVARLTQGEPLASPEKLQAILDVVNTDRFTLMTLETCRETIAKPDCRW